MARLFFAVWPDAAALARLERLAGELAAASAGKPVPAAKIHLTLAFLGEVDAARMESALSAARAVRFGRFAMTLDCVGSFRGARVAWAGSLATPTALACLHGDLAARLAAAGFTLEDRPFAAHVTLARRIGKAVPRAAIEPVARAVDGFSLVRSETGTGQYAVLEEFAGN
jgi:2'-5' RNA ligase